MKTPKPPQPTKQAAAEIIRLREQVTSLKAQIEHLLREKRAREAAERWELDKKIHATDQRADRELAVAIERLKPRPMRPVSVLGLMIAALQSFPGEGRNLKEAR